MTNFEKWKQDLTIKNLSKLLVQIDIQDCRNICPAYPLCEQTDTDSCYGVISRWANKECDDD